MQTGQRFIYVNDEKTKEKLEHAGFTFLKKTNNGYWVFLNKENELVFDKLDGAFISNVLTF